VFDLLGSPGENSTYNLQFRAPQFQCTVSQHNFTIPVVDTLHYEDGGAITGEGLPFLAFSSKLSMPTPKFSMSPLWTPIQSESLLYSVSNSEVNNIIVKRSLDNTTTYEALVEVVEHICRPYSMLYNVNISFTRGGRTIEHTVSDPKAVPNPVDLYDEYEDGYHWGIDLCIPAEPQALTEWRQRIFAALPVSNEWAILDALGNVLDVAWYREVFLYKPDTHKCVQRNAFDNGTMTYICESVGSDDGTHKNSTDCKSRVLPR
jgi:hypothetical protein